MSDTDTRLLDRSKMQVSTGTATMTMANADFTTWQAFCTIVPDGQHALYDTRVVVDLAKASTGFAAVATSATIQLSVARKVDGTNWRTATNLATTAVSGTNAAALSAEMVIGSVGPTEQVRLTCKLSAEGTDFVLPFVVYYRSGARATITAGGP